METGLSKLINCDLCDFGYFKTSPVLYHFKQKVLRAVLHAQKELKMDIIGQTAEIDNNYVIQSETRSIPDQALDLTISNEIDFNFASPEYYELFAKSSATAFQSPIWLKELYSQIAPRRSAEKIVITGREKSNNKLIFVLPLTRRKLKGIWLLESADLGVCDYSASIIHRDIESQLGKISTLHKDVKNAIGKFDILRLKAVREQSCPAWKLFFKGEFEQLDFSSHEAALSEDYAEWREDHFEAKHRKKIDQQTRRINSHHEHVEFELVPANQCAKIIEKIQQLRAGRFDGDPIQEDFVLSFYSKIAEQGQAEDFARTYILKAEGKFVGALFGLTNDKTHHGMLMACDYDAFGKFSPVFGMIDRLMADWHKDGGRICDFDIGDEDFKPKFGTKPVNLYKMTQSASPKGLLALKLLETTNRSI